MTDICPSVSVLILARNESENLAVLLPDIRQVLGDAGISFEILVVDAASPDGTRAF